jgi:hypothetical protein
MDALMNHSEVIGANANQTWDFMQVDGIVPYVQGTEEEDQKAEIACFVQLGAIPQLPTIGVDWTGFFLKEKTIGDLDFSIRKQLSDSGLTNHSISYSADGDAMTLVLNRSN